jgi:hypothetical protein
LWHGGSTYGVDKAKWEIVKKSTRQASWERMYNRTSAAILCTSLIPTVAPASRLFRLAGLKLVTLPVSSLSFDGLVIVSSSKCFPTRSW